MYASSEGGIGASVGKKGMFRWGREFLRGGEVPARESAMNLRNLREVETALAGMIFLMRRAVTTRDDGSYAYAGRAGYALLTHPPRSRDPATG